MVVCCRLVLVFAMLVAGMSLAWAQTTTLSLARAWHLAQTYDPTYQAAVSERDAGQANRALGRAPMLPQIYADIGRSKVKGTLRSPDSTGGTVKEDLNYMARTNQIKLEQTVFDWDKIMGWRVGGARADLSLAVFDTKARDITTRLVSRYLQTILAHENVVLAENNLEANGQHIKIAQRQYDAGEGTITDVREASSRHDLSRADLIQAQDALAIARHELQEMTGIPTSNLETISPDFAPSKLEPAELDAWLARAQAANADIHSGEQAFRVARGEVSQAFGGHLPSVNVSAARAIDESDTISTRNQKSYLNSMSLQIHVPIFSGGLTHAQVTQARHKRDQTGFELAATREQAAVETTRYYQDVISGARRIEALEQALETSTLALKAMERSYQAGTRSITDILDAQDQRYQTQRNLVEARLKYISARIFLDAVTGGLDDTVIEVATQTWFGPTTILPD